MTMLAQDKAVVFVYLNSAPDDGFTFKAMRRSLPKLKSTDRELCAFWEELKETGLIRPVDPLNADWFIFTGKGMPINENQRHDP